MDEDKHQEDAEPTDDDEPQDEPLYVSDLLRDETPEERREREEVETFPERIREYFEENPEHYKELRDQTLKENHRLLAKADEMMTHAHSASEGAYTFTKEECVDLISYIQRAKWWLTRDITETQIEIQGENCAPDLED